MHNPDLEVHLSLLIRPQPLRGSRLAGDYLAGRESVLAFFNGSPFDPASYRAKWEEVQRRFGRAERERAAAALRPTSPEAADRLRRFVEEGGAVVTTGQQAGLFTGPLYTIYKILSAIRLAEALEAELGVLVLPVFWTASEDHDWEEVNHTYVVDREDQLRRIAISSADPRPLPMSERLLDESIEAALAELEHTIGDAAGGEYLQLLRASYRPGATVADAFRQVIEGLFASCPLLVTDAADPELKRLSQPVLARELEAAAEHQLALRARTDELLAAGYHAQVAPLPGAANLFFHGEAGRERLHQVRDRWVTRESRYTFSAEELRGMLQENPARFSPNVALRPVVESAVFPTLSYVAGPGEISYFAQLGTLFESYGMAMPVVYPRFSALLLPERTRKLLEKLGLTIDELAEPRHELVTRLAQRELPEPVQLALRDLRSTLVEGYARLLDAASEVDPTLQGPLGASRNRSLAELARAERKILRQIKQRSEVINRQLDRVRAHVFPANSPQERALNLFPYLCREGTGLLRELAGEAEVGFPRAVAAPGG